MDSFVEVNRILSSNLCLNEKCEALIAYGDELGKHQLWSSVELIAVQCLRIQPGFRSAYKLLGKAMVGSDRAEDAQQCFKLRCPDAIIAEYFCDKGDYSRTYGVSDSDGTRILPAYPGKQQFVQPPKSINDLNSNKFDCLELIAPPAYIVHLEKGRLWYDGDNTVVWDKYGNVVFDLCVGNTDLIAQCADGLIAVKVQGSAFLLGNKGTANYYHWLNDALPGLGVLQKSGVSIETIDHFIARPLKKAFHKQTLARFGVDVSSLNESMYVEADDLYIPNFGRNKLGRNQQRWTPEFLDSMFPREDVTKPSLKLYISRGDSGARGVINEPAVIKMVERLGFEVVKLENIELKDQAELFSRASVILGPHGAGFTNAVFCKPGTKIIEFFSEHVEPCFWITSELIDLEHYAHYCAEPSEKRVESSGSEKDHAARVADRLSALYLDLTELDNLLKLAQVA